MILTIPCLWEKLLGQGGVNVQKSGLNVNNNVALTTEVRKPEKPEQPLEQHDVQDIDGRRRHPLPKAL